MDSLAQFLMGACVGQLILGPKHKGKGALIGGIAGSLPDLDVIPLMTRSVVDQLVHHRGISHSLLFCFFSPFVFGWFSRQFIRWNITYLRWYIFWAIAFFTHTLLDVMTTWGTQLFWPFSKKTSLDSLFIIDPLITLPLLIGCIGSTWKRSYKPALVGVCFITFYLIFSITAHSFMMSKFKNAFETQQIKIDSQMVRPTPFNTLFWAVSATTDSEELIFGYARLWDSPNTIEFSKPVNQNLEQLTPIAQRYDLNQLLAITRGFYIVESSENIIVIKDARFGKFGRYCEENVYHRRNIGIVRSKV